MRDLLLLTAFIFMAAYLHKNRNRKIALYNQNITEGQAAIKQSVAWFVLAMAVMAFLAACRSADIGNDTKAYIDIFNQVINNPDYISTTRYEKGYLYLNKFVGLFTDNPQYLFAIIAIFQYYVFSWFIIKHSKDVAFSLVLFFFLMYSGTLNILRQEIATAFIFIAADRILGGKTWRAVIWIAVASLFHSSAILFIIIPFAPYIKYNNYAAIVIFAIIILLMFTNSLYAICLKILPDYAHYFEGKYSQSGWLAIGYQMVRNFLVFVPALITHNPDRSVFDKAKITAQRQNNLAEWCLFGAFAGIVFGFRVNLIDRIIAYMVAFYIVLLPNFLVRFGKESAFFIKVMAVLFMFAYAVLVQAIRPEWNVIFPYEFFWKAG